MAKSLLDLANSLERKAKAIEEAASQTAVDTALAIVGDLAYKTPVDTSQALSNWQVTLDSPATGSISPHYPGLQGSTQRASAAETLNLAKAVLKTKKPGQAIYITNNLPYIKRLNDGYSAQAPAGFVERAVLIGRKMLSKFKIKD
uniref:Tail completion protein n=1 Tax=Stenotrophomonas phage vB_SmaS_QH3 TaxID=3229738 RepID=A0AAU7YTK6_9CAUD